MLDVLSMGEEHNVVFGQGPRVNRAKSTLTSSSICLMRHMEGEVGVLLALLTLGPCPKTTLCSSPIALPFMETYHELQNFKRDFGELKPDSCTRLPFCTKGIFLSVAQSGGVHFSG